MTRKLLLLFATLLASIGLLVGPALAPARAADPPTPVVKTNTGTFFCMGGLPLRAVCLTL